MVSRCIVRSCGQLTYRYNLPPVKGQALIWILRTGNKDLDKKKQLRAKICPRHFNKQCCNEFGRKLLRKGALPSLFLPDYTPTGEDKDNFYFEKPVATISTHTSEKIKTILNMSLASKIVTYSLPLTVKTPEKTYSKRRSSIHNEMVPVARTSECSKTLVVPKIDNKNNQKENLGSSEIVAMDHCIASTPECTKIPLIMYDIHAGNSTGSSKKRIECRTCLELLTEENNISLETEVATEITVLEALKKLADIQVSETDLLPQQICEKCFSNLQSAIHFTTQVTSSDEKLKNRLHSLTDPLLIKLEPCVIKTEEFNMLDNNVNKPLEDIETVTFKMEVVEDNIENTQQSSQRSQNFIIETGHHQDQLNTRHIINVIVNNNKKERQKRYREQNRDKLKRRETEKRKRIQYSQSIAGPSTSSIINRKELNNEQIITAISQNSSGLDKTQPSSIQRNEQGKKINALQKKRERQQRYREQNRDKLKQREAERRRRLQHTEMIAELSTSPNIEFTEIINEPIIDEISTNSRSIPGLGEMQHVVVEVSQQNGRGQSSANVTEIPNNYSQFR